MNNQFTPQMAKSIAVSTRRVQDIPYTIARYGTRHRGGGGSRGDTSSFAFKSTSADTVALYTGTVKWSGRLSKKLVDPTCTVPGGTVDDPVFVQVVIPVESGPTGAFLECSATDRDDDGTNLYNTVGEAYLVDGIARWKRDRRSDIVMRTPIK